MEKALCNIPSRNEMIRFESPWSTFVLFNLIRSFFRFWSNFTDVRVIILSTVTEMEPTAGRFNFSFAFPQYLISAKLGYAVAVIV